MKEAHLLTRETIRFHVNDLFFWINELFFSSVMSTEELSDYFFNDCHTFVANFKKKKSLSFEAFGQVWKESRFAFSLWMWKNYGDILEATNELLEICKRIWLRSETVDECVCGLYLLRTIYQKQPAPHFVKIPISHDDWRKVKQFTLMIRDVQEKDIRYVLRELYEFHAFSVSTLDFLRTIEANESLQWRSSLLMDVSEIQSSYSEIISKLKEENDEYSAQRKACERLYPELSKYPTVDVDSLVKSLSDKLNVFQTEAGRNRQPIDTSQGNGLPASGEVRLDSEKRSRKGSRYFLEEKSSDSEGEEDWDCDMPSLTDDSETDFESLVRSPSYQQCQSDIEKSSSSSEEDKKSDKGETMQLVSKTEEKQEVVKPPSPKVRKTDPQNLRRSKRSSAVNRRRYDVDGD